MSSSHVQLHTFGCKVNTYDTGLLQKRLQAQGFVTNSKEASVHILNSCAVTAEATREAIRQARKIKAKNPLATVVMTGCSAQVDGDLIDDLPGIDLVVANSHKGELESILRKYFLGEIEQKVFRSNIFRNESLGEGGGEEQSHTRSFLKIQDGCNSFCTFCIIPYARGTSRSLPIDSLLKKIRSLDEQGVREVVLTGVHIGDYCDEESFGGPYYLDDLVEQVLQNTKIPRVRLTSLEPIELTDKLMDLFKNPRLCPHFHISLQSGSTDILQAMKRKYSAVDVERALQWIDETLPKAYVGMDVIVGFPGETEELFLETYNNLKRWPWTRIHVFPYSERKGTRAALSKDVVPVRERKRRSKILRDLSFERHQFLASQQVGELKKVILLKNNNGGARGLSRDYWDIFLENTELLNPGDEVEVKILGYERGSQDRLQGYLRGELNGR
ncbi:MAG: tRNA (N(6)-L-threonylcarbamoyladenosine(37)-C(2))-methylthiotransferase MtaB [Bdellovibrionales bacterium]|nr:tRNA (N(6)-L-threonylcarbamoyladenosine(37)-C(2))-methylthiotransferase MtaB [Bdellovibrionales bacterium]